MDELARALAALDMARDELDRARQKLDRALVHASHSSQIADKWSATCRRDGVEAAKKVRAHCDRALNTLNGLRRVS